MGNCFVSCDVEQIYYVHHDDDLRLPHQIKGCQFLSWAGVPHIRLFEDDHEMETSTTPAPQLLAGEGTHTRCAIVTDVQECVSAASPSQNTEEGVHLSLDEDSFETNCGGSEMVKFPKVKWGSYVSPLEISKFTQGGVCNLCHSELSGAITMGLCGHIFHERCVEKRKSYVCPCCKEFIDEPSEKSEDSKRIPVLTKGTTVMLQGLRFHRSLNGTYCKIISYNDASNKYLVRLMTSWAMYRVNPMNVVDISVE